MVIYAYDEVFRFNGKILSFSVEVGIVRFGSQTCGFNIGLLSVSDMIGSNAGK